MLKGGFVNIERKFIRIFGVVKNTVFLAFTIAGYNRDRIRSFLAKRAEQKRIGQLARRRRAKRRQGTWARLLPGGPEASGRDPP
jgi:hypothetical protein